MKTKKTTNQVSFGDRSLAERLLWLFLVATTAVLPFAFSHGMDGMRVPKDALFEAAAILLASGLVITLLLSPASLEIGRRVAANRSLWMIAAAAVIWTLVTTLVSTQRRLSVESLAWVVCSAMFIIVAAALAHDRPLRSVQVVLIPALLSAMMAIVQRSTGWNPFGMPDALPIRFKVSAFIGNPDFVGLYLLLPAVAAMVLIAISAGPKRWLYSAMLVILLGGMAASETLSTTAAFVAAFCAFLLLISRRAAAIAAGGAALLLAICFAFHLPIAERIRTAVSQFRQGQYFEVITRRSLGFLSAWNMFKEHPITGVGPGTYGFWYLPYKMLSLGSHPDFLRSGENFHEAHNDHLQTLATGGLPAYLIFLAALWLLARLSFVQFDETDDRARFAHTFAFPAATALVVVAAAQSPLELSAPLATGLFLVALQLSWSRER